jgi:hypothetical protein
MYVRSGTDIQKESAGVRCAIAYRRSRALRVCGIASTHVFSPRASVIPRPDSRLTHVDRALAYGVPSRFQAMGNACQEGNSRHLRFF